MPAAETCAKTAQPEPGDAGGLEPGEQQVPKSLQSFTLKEAVNREARRAAEPVGCRQVPGEQHCLF